MHIYKTDLSKISHIPPQLDFLRAASRRELLKTTKEKSLYRNLELGAEGEQYVLEALEKYGRKHWVVLQNLWLEQYGVYESDIILLTNHIPYVFEVKNYNGLFEVKKNRCFINGRKLKENCIQQAEKSLMNLQEICGTIDRSISVKGALLMVGEHNDVRMDSELDGIELVTRQQIRNFIQQIVREEEEQYHKSYDSQRLLNHFEKNATLNPFGPLKSYSPEEVLEGTRGIYCKTCGTYDVESTKIFVKCKNSHQELRRDAILRTIHEFGILTFDYDFMTRRNLELFLGGLVSKPFLVDILNDNFERTQNGRYSKYINKKGFINDRAPNVNQNKFR